MYFNFRVSFIQKYDKCPVSISSGSYVLDFNIVNDAAAEAAT